MKELQLRIVSTVRSRASWAKVAREMALAFMDLGLRVMIEEDPHGGAAESTTPLPPRLEAALATRIKRPDIDLLITEPEHFAEVARAKYVTGLMVFEATRWPLEWVEAARNGVDRVITPSHFCLDGLIASGMPADRVFVVPHGIDPKIYWPAPRAKAKGLRLLFVGTPSRRKGLYELLDALLLLPMSLGPVTLTVKTERWPDRQDRWLPAASQLDALAARGIAVTFCDADFDEVEMAELYRTHDLLCAPHLGEGFGIALLEAMACGTPLVASNWSGSSEFFDAKVGWPVEAAMAHDPASLLPSRFPAPVDARMYGVCPEALAAALKAADDTAARAIRGATGAARARHWTWHASAKAFLQGVGVEHTELAG